VVRSEIIADLSAGTAGTYLHFVDLVRTVRKRCANGKVFPQVRRVD
jgi:hypothetical protein